MGTPIPWPVEGVECPHCWGEGKPFYSYASPKFIQVTVTGMKRGSLWVPANGEPPNGLWELQQDDPCEWLSHYSPWTFNLWYDLDSTVLAIHHLLYLNVFYGVNGPCSLEVTNEFGWWSQIWEGGTAAWTWLGGP